MWLRSKLLEQSGFPRHGFSTRLGGISEGDFSSWNFSTSTGDSSENVEKNYQILAEHMGVTREDVYAVHQIHSNRIVKLDSAQQQTQNEKADGLYTALPNKLVGVKTADCVPVLIADPASKAVAAVHAGWRGVVSGIVAKALEDLRKDFPNALPVVAIGPHISAARFQVGPEVAEEFPNHHRPDPSQEGKFLVDLQSYLIEQIMSFGIPRENIDTMDACTLSEPERFFSHRGSGGRTGRLFNFIVSPK